MPVDKGSTPQPKLMIEAVMQQCNITQPVNDQVKAIIMALLTAYNYDIPKVKEQYNVGKKMKFKVFILTYCFKWDNVLNFISRSYFLSKKFDLIHVNM